MPLSLSMPVSAPPAEALRQEFLLDPDVVFLNHGSFGATPEPVFAEYGRWQRELERQPVEFLGRRAEDLLDEARAAMAAYLGCARDDLVFVPNATTGINVVAKSLPLEPGDEVVGTDLEYGACERSWEWFCQQRGARYVKAHVPLPLTSPDEVVEAIFAAVTPRTRAIFLSHVTSGTALRLPDRGGGATGARGGNPDGRRWRARGRPMAGRPGRQRRRSLRQQLSQVALRAEGFRVSLCSPGPAGDGWSRRSSPGVGWKGTTITGRRASSSPATRFRAPAISRRFSPPRRRWRTRKPGTGKPCANGVMPSRSEARDRIAALAGLPQIAPVESPDGYRWFRQMAVAPLPRGDRRQGAEAPPLRRIPGRGAGDVVGRASRSSGFRSRVTTRGTIWKR